MDSIRSKCTTCQPGGSGRLSKAIRLWTGFGIKTSLAEIVPLNWLMWNYWSDLSLDADCALFMWAQILSHTHALPNYHQQTPPPFLFPSFSPFLFHAHTHIQMQPHERHAIHKAEVYPQTYCQWPRKLSCITRRSSNSFKVKWLHQSWLLRSPAIKIKDFQRNDQLWHVSFVLIGSNNMMSTVNTLFHSLVSVNMWNIQKFKSVEGKALHSYILQAVFSHALQKCVTRKNICFNYITTHQFHSLWIGAGEGLLRWKQRTCHTYSRQERRFDWPPMTLMQRAFTLQAWYRSESMGHF